MVMHYLTKPLFFDMIWLSLLIYMKYEFAFLLPNASRQETEKVFSSIRKELETLKGKVNREIINNIEFAYPVKKERRGFFCVFFIELEPENVQKVKEFLKFHSPVLREMFIKVEKEPAPVETVPERRAETIKEVSEEALDKAVEAAVATPAKNKEKTEKQKVAKKEDKEEGKVEKPKRIRKTVAKDRPVKAPKVKLEEIDEKLKEIL